MRVLVTGAAGFIGSHLTDHLLHRGHAVVGLDDLSAGSLDNLALARASRAFSFIEGDVRNRIAVDDAMRGCDAVVHLAARIGLRMIVESPLRTLEVNAHGTETVLQAAARDNTPTIVASTSEVYGHSLRFPSHEDDPISIGSPTIGRWSYACAKIYDEFYALALHRERELPVVISRLFNTVGTRQTGRYGMVIPRLIRQALAREPLTVYGDGTQTRCFCAIEDVVHALLVQLERFGSVAGEIFNIGNPIETPIIDLAKRIIQRTGSTSTIELVPFSDVYPAGFEEIMRRVPDISKAERLLQFQPHVTLDATIDAVSASLKEGRVLV
ncbi:MAG TPA: NAD-dependent epimerase/dehydratase family protein [Candidatus Acidoferrum sp.]|jgi:UDP-glucose 4-epimerase|nr:NAD-dependent epimerase/dehydratase family protein [Candidatus Acidoferrum sp.]